MIRYVTTAPEGKPQPLPGFTSVYWKDRNLSTGDDEKGNPIFNVDSVANLHAWAKTFARFPAAVLDFEYIYHTKFNYPEMLNTAKCLRALGSPPLIPHGFHPGRPTELVMPRYFNDHDAEVEKVKAAHIELQAPLYKACGFVSLTGSPQAKSSDWPDVVKFVDEQCRWAAKVKFDDGTQVPRLLWISLVLNDPDAGRPLLTKTEAARQLDFVEDLHATGAIDGVILYAPALLPDLSGVPPLILKLVA